MINDETRRKLREIQLEEMIQAIDRQAKDTIYATLSFDERMKMIVDYVYQEKHNKRVISLIKRARFRIPNAAIQDVFFAERHLDKDLILEIAACSFISNNQNIVVCGFTGSGKSYLACSIGKEACKQGIRTRYIRLPDLLMEYSEAKIQPNGQSRELKKYTNYPLLILDEWLITDLSDDELHFLFELVERRYDNGATIFCTQYKIEEWHARLGGGVLADSIMDRIIHGAHIISSGSINMRDFVLNL
ncbi:ATP-binding protein [Acetobacterium bakii]|uniref:ATP-binding protein n=1 Tax=Acetobacterium bakii TaxID=52689 RepID=A0A0L6TV71_9FIRM|nr:ATP-binding protein [Acetobacterium bakii]KNZ40171.1 ATP-binding protein [Acetobacterium bakii]